MRTPSEKGFTLIELMMVVLVLGILMAILFPNLFTAKTTIEIKECQAKIMDLVGAAKGYQTECGDYPVDSVVDLPGRFRKYKLAANKTNQGIEIFVVSMAVSGFPAGLNLLDSLEGQEQLGNTDEDKAGVMLGPLQHRRQMEILDHWGNPFAYFHHRNYSKTQVVCMGDGSTQVVQAVRNPKTRGFMMPRGIQIISAGLDGDFGTKDDVANFSIPGR